MPPPPLDARGLLPVGRHVCTLDEIHAAFCWDAHRLSLWNGLIEFLKVLTRESMVFPIGVDGSFTTDKERPADIDVVLDLRRAPEVAQVRGVLWFRQRRAEFRDNYHIDFCPNLPHDNDFTDFFQYVGTKTAHIKNLRREDRRGILIVEQWQLG